jgi:hypothetical protein
VTATATHLTAMNSWTKALTLVFEQAFAVACSCRRC